MNDPLIVCEARIADDHASIVLTPLMGGRDRAVRTILRAAGVPHQRAAAGTAVRIPAAASPKLLDGLTGLELRWRSDARRFVELRQAAACSNQELRGFLGWLATADRPEVERMLPELKDAETLDDHQVRNVAAMTLPGTAGLAVFDEQGSGKTVTGLFALDVLFARDEIGLAVIVAPKSMVGEWPREIARFRPGAYIVEALDGPKQKKLLALQTDPDIIVCSFETVVSLERELAARARRYAGRAALVVDESFFVKNQDARRSRAVRRVREWFERCYVLCGTPAPNAARDLVAQIDLVDLGATFHGISIPEDGAQAHAVVLTVLQERGVFLRSRKEEVLPDLPPRSFEVVRVDLAPDQSTAYQHALRDLIVDLRVEDDAGYARRLLSYGARRSALLQICSNPINVVPGYRETPAKLVALDDIVERLVRQRRQKIVVWSFYTASLEAILDRYERDGAIRYDGAVTNTDQRREAVRRFQEDDDARLFVANPAAAGAGLTLHASHVAVYESMSNQPAHFMQSVDRIHRRGQTSAVTYIVLLGRDTLDEREYDRLADKQSAARSLLGDPGDGPPTREALLAELLDVARASGLTLPAVPS